jgi:hypothetical protein
MSLKINYPKKSHARSECSGKHASRQATGECDAAPLAIIQILCCIWSNLRTKIAPKNNVVETVSDFVTATLLATTIEQTKLKDNIILLVSGLFCVALAWGAFQVFGQYIFLTMLVIAMAAFLAKVGKSKFGNEE